MYPLFQDEIYTTMPTRIKGEYYICSISPQKAQQISVRFHYLHRKAPCSQAFGMFSSSELCGIIMYGTPSSHPLRVGICGPEEKFNVVELTRLWIQNGTPKNAESFLIGNTIPKVNKEIIVSYADPSYGHLGIVYQATNWIYTGLSTSHIEYFAGDNRHIVSLYESMRSKRSNECQLSMFGDLRPDRGRKVEKLFELNGNVKVRDQVRKHRYVYFNADRRRKRELMAKLRYPIIPYPKHNKDVI